MHYITNQHKKTKKKNIFMHIFFAKNLSIFTGKVMLICYKKLNTYVKFAFQVYIKQKIMFILLFRMQIKI